MALPHQPDARRFYQAAMQRLEDARQLLAAGRTTGAAYLAGYAAECMLKALVLASVTAALGRSLLADFRGQKAHNIGWLRGLYLQHVGADIPRDVSRRLTSLNTWSPELRYSTGVLKREQARELLDSVEEVVTWADGRM